jgi:hypothetical protein
LTIPALRLLEYVPTEAIFQVREMGGPSAYMAGYARIAELVAVDGIEGVASSGGRIRFLRLTATRPEIERRLVEFAIERQRQAKQVEQDRKRGIRPTPESRFSLKFTYREHVGDSRIVVLKRVTKSGRFVTWRGTGFSPNRFNPDAIPAPLRRY